MMKLIVGLGNPGKTYEKTRHNVGFLVIDVLADKLGIEVKQKKFRALIAQTKINDETVILMKPQTYMNLSGDAVIKAMQFYNIEPQDILVIYDDMDLPAGKLRLREKGSAGGHKGMKDIIHILKTQEINRIRIGIGTSDVIDTKVYVLDKIPKEEYEVFEKGITEAANACIDSIKMSFGDLMAKYNYRKKDETIT